MKGIPFRCPECGKKFKAHLRAKSEKPYTYVRCTYCTRKFKIDIREIEKELEKRADVYSKTADDSACSYEIIDKKKPSPSAGLVVIIKYN